MSAPTIETELAARMTMPVRPRTAGVAVDLGVPEASFESTLRTRSARLSEHEAQEAAEQLVATALVQPFLAEARAGNTAAEPFAPGAAERRFGPLLDQHVAERVVRGARFPLVDRLREHLLGAPGTTTRTDR